MIDLREKIKAIIERETASGHFSALNEDSVELIQQIIENYEITHDLHQDMEDLPKCAELIFVAAPTGAGKDSLVIQLNINNPGKNYIELNMDIFRHYFAKFIDDESKLTDKNFAELTNEFSYEMYITIQEILLQYFPGTNIIITGTLRETDWVEETFKKFKNCPHTNYKTILASLAVPKKESATSVIKRYVEIVDLSLKDPDFHKGTARYTSLKYHDETFDRFPENLGYFQKLFQKGELIDEMRVYRRSKDLVNYSDDTLVYSSDRQEDKGKDALSVVNELRRQTYEMKREESITLLGKIAAEDNFNYLKSQSTIREVVAGLANLFGYRNIFERLNSDTEPDIN